MADVFRDPDLATAASIRDPPPGTVAATAEVRDHLEDGQLVQRLRGAAAVASFLAAVLTEIYLRGVCFCQEILRRNGRGQAGAGGDEAQAQVCMLGWNARVPSYVAQVDAIRTQLWKTFPNEMDGTAFSGSYWNEADCTQSFGLRFFRARG